MIDELVWLIKAVYSSKEALKRKDFRIDKLFSQYIIQNKIELKKIAKIFPSLSNLNSQFITDDLKRGWYNELAFVIPLKEATLGLSFNDIDINKDKSNDRFTFPSWRITSFYYSVYFYLRAITLQKEPNIRIQEHGSAISAFKHNLIPRLERVLWKFPFDISWTPSKRVYRRDLPICRIEHLKHRYSCHPRNPNRSPAELFNNIHKALRKKGIKPDKAVMYTLFDYFHDFRIWANYLDIDNLLSLWGSGYKGFLDQNLSLLLFFIGGISELGFISVHGQEKYCDNLQRFYELFALNNTELERDFIYTPPYQRMAIFNKLGIIDKNIVLRREFDINAINIG